MVKHGTAEFFKVFLPDISSHQLKIPPDFVNKFHRTLKEKVMLKDLGGKVWHVDVERTRDGVFLKKGWQGFVSHHNLIVGEFIVFKYDGSYSFIVKIYGINGCKRELFAAKRVKVEQEIEAEQSLGSKEPSEEELQKVAASKLPESCEDIKPADIVFPKYPYFVSRLIPSTQYNLRIPTEVFNAHNLHLKLNMILRNANGKEWDVRILNAKDGRVYIAKGWSTFWKDNNMGFEDSCRFTFATEKLSKIIHVQILRAKERRY